MKVKGYIPKKPIQDKPDLLGDIVAVHKLVDDLKDAKSTVEERIEQVETVIRETHETTAEIIGKMDIKVTEFEETAVQLIENIKNIPQLQGQPGKDADQVDTKALAQEVLSLIPEPQKIDEKKLKKDIIASLPDRKADLKIIQENIEIDPMSVIEKIMALPEEKRKKLQLGTDNISGLQQTIHAFQSQLGRGYLHGGGISEVIHDTTLTGKGTTTSPLSVVSAGTGTVTSVSVVSANGFAGTVATATTTPAITLSTTISGLLKGNGTAISAAVANTDFQSPIALTTTGTSGASTFNGTTLNIPNYANTTYTAGTGLTLTGTQFTIDSTVATLTGSQALTNKSVNGVVLVTGGSSTAYLSEDGTYSTPASGGSPGGMDTQIQFNDSGTFGGDAGLTFSKALLNFDYNGAGTGSFVAQAFSGGAILSADTNGITTVLGSTVNVTSSNNLNVNASSNLVLTGSSLFALNAGSNSAQLDFTTLTADRLFTFPDTAGTFALISDLPVFQTNATPNGNQSLLNLVAGTNITLTDDGIGGVTIDASGGGGGGSTTPYAETPSGTINSSNVTFTLANTPADSNGVVVILDGTVQYNGIDYSVSGATITFTTAPVTGSSIFAYYNTFTSSTPQIPQNSKSAAYTTVLSDAGKHIFHPSADTSARTWTIDSNANVAYPIGTTLSFVNQNAAGVITIAITSDTMRLAGSGTTGSRTLAANGIATALKITSTEWIINGTNLT